MTQTVHHDPAADLVEELQRTYREYIEAGQKAQNVRQGFADLFSGWFQPPGYSPSTPEDDHFVADVQRLVPALAERLKDGSSDMQEKNALAALQIMLQPAECSASQKLYLCAVLDQGELLAPYLSTDARAELCRQMRTAEEPRRYLPSQRRLYEALRGQ